MEPTVEPTTATYAGARRAFLGGRLLVVVSAAVMALFMLGGVFAIGVWYGEGRPDTTATFGGFRGGPPGGVGGNNAGQPGNFPGDNGPPGRIVVPPGGQGQSVAGLLDVLSGPPDIVGQVVSLNGSSLTVSSQAGRRTVTLTADTNILRSDGTDGTRGDLARGSFVAMVGTAGNGGLSFTVDEIAVADQ